MNEIVRLDWCVDMSQSTYVRIANCTFTLEVPLSCIPNLPFHAAHSNVLSTYAQYHTHALLQNLQSSQYRTEPTSGKHTFILSRPRIREMPLSTSSSARPIIDFPLYV
jgi:hypothetical protein